MFNASELLHKAEQLTVTDKWWLVKQLLLSLESEQIEAPASTDWHTFLRETYGSLRETPLQRWDQGEYEEREPLE